MSEEDWLGQVEVEMPTKLRAKNTLDSESESDVDISHSGALECSLVGLTSSRLCLMIRGWFLVSHGFHIIKKLRSYTLSNNVGFSVCVRMLDYAYTMRPETEDFSVFVELDSKKGKYRGLAVTKKEGIHVAKKVGASTR